MSMADNEKKALEYLSQAEGKLKGGGGGFFSKFVGGSSSKKDDAIDLYQKAGNCFKMAKKWQGAGDAFTKSAELNLDCSVRHEAASQFLEAANCYRKTDPSKAVQSLSRSIEIYTEMGKFTIAAKHHQTTAEIYEQELADSALAVKHYEQAADYFTGENATSAANKCVLKVAHFSAQMEQYNKAATIFEQVGKTSMENNLLKYGAKEYFFKATLCHLCLDKINGENSLKKYEEMYPTFTDSREYKLLKTLIECIDNEDLEGFTNTIKEYDSISRIDPWVTKLLLKIRNTCGLDTAEEGDGIM